MKKHKAAIIREINRDGKIGLHPLLNSKNSMKFEQDIKVARIYEMLLVTKMFLEKIYK